MIDVAIIIYKTILRKQALINCIIYIIGILLND